MSGKSRKAEDYSVYDLILKPTSSALFLYESVIYYHVKAHEIECHYKYLQSPK